jgi:hypothetical protein
MADDVTLFQEIPGDASDAERLHQGTIALYGLGVLAFIALSHLLGYGSGIDQSVVEQSVAGVRINSHDVV